MDFEAIVIGGGHAGIEASLALARLGRKTLLVTQNPDAIGRMSCNPAVGGLGKGNLVREIDALGGEMGRLIDASLIQFRMLNRSRGPAVRAPRAQADKALYAALARRSLESQAGLSILMETVVDLLEEAGPGGMPRVAGVRTARGREILAKAVVLAAGTFMEGRIFIGDWSHPSGRLGEEAAQGLGAALRGRGFPVHRLKTGTPARIKRGSVRLESLELDPGEEEARPFSFLNDSVVRPRLPCWIAWTTESTHRIIAENLHRSALYGGKIVGRGPRYCPSIEDKVRRFPDRPRHQVFVEPEGEYTDELYLNGLSTSLPESVQEAFIRSIPGLEKAEIVRPGYAVEYDCLDPRELSPSLESRRLRGLFVAGQTNGSSGYEEAAAQGLVAGINAARLLAGEEALLLGRHEAYIGVLVDDLVRLGAEEPYRMFTSRAERRIGLRQDSADRRLTPKAIALGLASAERRDRFGRKLAEVAEVAALLESRRVSREDLGRAPGLGPRLGSTLAELLRDPRLFKEEGAGGGGEEGEGSEPSSATIDDRPLLERLYPDLAAGCSREALETAELDARYAGYAEKEDRLALRFERSERQRIPEDFDYASVSGLSSESREKLERARPSTLGQASRLPGVRTSDAALLLIALTRKDRAGPA